MTEKITTIVFFFKNAKTEFKINSRTIIIETAVNIANDSCQLILSIKYKRLKLYVSKKPTEIIGRKIIDNTEKTEHDPIMYNNIFLLLLI